MSSRTSRSERTLYVGNLPSDIRESEVEDLFYKYGKIVQIDLKIHARPPSYAFVEFEDVRDAEDAIHGRDGYKFDGNRLRVELAHGGRGSSSFERHRSSNGGVPRGGGVSRRTSYRVKVTGLPSSASWQDLKDHMRKAGDVCFSEVFRDGRDTTGIVDYTNYDDMKYAIKKLDDTEFKNAFSRGYIKVRVYESKRSSSRSCSRSYSRSRSHSRGHSLSRSKSPKPKSRSKSGSPRPRSASKEHSLSRSRSRSRSPVNLSESKGAVDKSPKELSPTRSRSLSRSRSRSRSPVNLSESKGAVDEPEGAEPYTEQEFIALK